MNEDLESKVDRVDSRAVGLEVRVQAIEGIVFGTKNEIGIYHIIKQAHDEIVSANREIESLKAELNQYKWWLRGIIAAVTGTAIAAGWMLSTWSKILGVLKSIKP